MLHCLFVRDDLTFRASDCFSRRRCESVDAHVPTTSRSPKSLQKEFFVFRFFLQWVMTQRVLLTVGLRDAIPVRLCRTVNDEWMRLTGWSQWARARVVVCPGWCGSVQCIGGSKVGSRTGGQGGGGNTCVGQRHYRPTGTGCSSVRNIERR